MEISPNRAYCAVSLHPSEKHMLLPKDCMMISVRTKTVARAPVVKKIFLAACFRSIMVPLNTPDS
jgi:hypothetical protein